MPSASQTPKNQTPPITPSSRSITPPCPGISRLASLTPKRRLTADSSRSPSCEQTAIPRLSRPIQPGSSRPRGRSRSPVSAREGEAADRAGPGLAGADPRPQLGAADAAADEVGADVGRDDDQHQPEDQPDPLGLAGAQHDQRPHRQRPCRGSRHQPATTAARRPPPPVPPTASVPIPVGVPQPRSRRSPWRRRWPQRGSPGRDARGRRSPSGGIPRASAPGSAR